MLGMLLATRDADDGSALTDREVRDQAMTIMLAGHETTANALAWTFYLLARHPDVRERLEREVDAALGERSATVDDLPRCRSRCRCSRSRCASTRRRTSSAGALARR